MTINRIELKGARIGYGGSLHKIKWAAAAERIAQGGGEATTQIDALTCFVAGTRAGSKETAARIVGAAIIDEAQLLALLERGFIELDERRPFATGATFDESVAELRAIFNAPPSAEGWTRCLELIEGCDPARLGDLITYAEPFVAAWDSAPLGKWSAPADHPLMAHAPELWRFGLPADELRVAPPGWIFEILGGHHHPKHGLARAINLEDMPYKSKAGANLLKSPHLRAVRVLNLGWSKDLPQGFFADLRTCELMRTVEELWVEGAFGVMAHAWAPRDHSFDALRVIRTGTKQNRQFIRKSPCAKGVTYKEMPTLTDLGTAEDAP